MTCCLLKTGTRSDRGNYVAELPGVLMVIFFLFCFPLINLGTMALRYGILLTAAREGANAAAKSYTFETGTTALPPAIVSAPQAVNTLLGKFTGVTVQSIDVDILAINLSTNVVTRYENKLSQAADATQSVYCVETEIVGQLQPLTNYHAGFLSNIPGLTGPITIKVAAREFSEAPQGLSQ